MQNNQDFMQKIEKVQSLTNAFVTIIKNKTEINPELPLSKVKVALKDNISTKGILTSSGSKSLSNYYPVFNATVVDKLEAVGVEFIGKTAMDELGMGGTGLSSYTGPIANPYDLKRVAGGSSGGSAVAVSTGLARFALGTDTGDSIRKPASYCGVVGVKPTYGRVSRYGVMPYASSLDHVGYFASNIKDAATFLSFIAGRDDKDMTSSKHPVEDYASFIGHDLRGKTFGFLKNIYDVCPLEIQAELDKLQLALKRQEINVKMVEVDQELLKAIYGTYMTIVNAESITNHASIDGIKYGVSILKDTVEASIMETRTEGFSLNTKRRMILGGYALEPENQEKYYWKALKIRRLIVEEFEKVFKKVDCLLAIGHIEKPQLINKPKKMTIYDEALIAENYQIFANFNGYPSITLPFMFKEGLPYGINVTAQPFEEGNLFNYCQTIEDITGLKDLIKEL